MKKVYTAKEFDAELKKSKRILAIFYANWCPFCVGFVPTFEETVEKMGFQSIIHVLLDDYDNPLWDDYDVPAVPTIIYFEDGKVCDRLDAQLGLGLNEKAFKKWIEQLAIGTSSNSVF